MHNFYYFNKNTDINGYHEVHAKNCKYIPDIGNRILIGFCEDCNEALKKAKNENPLKKFDGCFYCSTDCHKW